MMQPQHQTAYIQTMQTMRGVVADLNHLQRCIERGETVEQIKQRLVAITDVTASKTTLAGNALYQALQTDGDIAETGEIGQSAHNPAAPTCANLEILKTNQVVDRT